MRVAVIFLGCLSALVAVDAQDSDSGGPPQRGGLPITLRSARFQRLPTTRPVAPTQSVFTNARIRRPISFKPKGTEDNLGIGPGNYPSIRPGRPLLPSAPGFSPQIKPVNEEPEEAEKPRDNIRDRDDHEDFSQEQDEPDDESEENVARAVANLGALGTSSLSRPSGGYHSGPASQQPQPSPIQYRPPPITSVPTGRGNVGTPSPVPPQSSPQYRPAPKQNKPRKQIIEEPFKQQIKPPPKSVKSPQQYDARGKKPVAQSIRRYRTDNPDGSITWGFENDDGSYKEEVIGVDCMTRGKYGYIDPDGNRREYTYETGIKCDEEQREEDEENGFVDYQENKLVLPDGKTIDLASMGKKQLRRPRPYGQ